MSLGVQPLDDDSDQLGGHREKNESLAVTQLGSSGFATAVKKDILGVDVFVHWRGLRPRLLAQTMRCADNRDLELTLITNGGVKMWPVGVDERPKSEHWRCRFTVRKGRTIDHTVIANLQLELAYIGVNFFGTEHLFDGEPISLPAQRLEIGVLGAPHGRLAHCHAR